jgi:hypothetical protein
MTRPRPYRILIVPVYATGPLWSHAVAHPSRTSALAYARDRHREHAEARVLTAERKARGEWYRSEPEPEQTGWLLYDLADPERHGSSEFKAGAMRRAKRRLREREKRQREAELRRAEEEARKAAEKVARLRGGA